MQGFIDMLPEQISLFGRFNLGYQKIWRKLSTDSTPAPRLTPRLKSNTKPSSSTLSNPAPTPAISWSFTKYRSGSELLRTSHSTLSDTLPCIHSRLKRPRPPRCSRRYTRGMNDLGGMLPWMCIILTQLIYIKLHYSKAVVHDAWTCHEESL